MLENILTVAGAVAQSAEQTNKLMVQTVNTGFENGLFARFADLGFDFFARLFDHFLDPCGMNAPVKDELFECNSRNFAAHGVKSGKDDRFGRVVNDKIDACCDFECADIASFPADDAAFHFIVGQSHNGNGGFRNMIRCAALNRH